MIGLPYRDTFAAKGSALHAAMESPQTTREALVARVYKETTTNYAKLYPKADREWMETWKA